MVAIISNGYSIQRMLNYNEQKVQQGVARCISAVNYPADPDRMSYQMKLNRLLNQMQLHETAKRNSVQVTLNFDPSETALNAEKMTAIAESYMEKLGFGGQPYLIYQHFDAGHPHLHLVTTNIQANGKRIDMHRLAIRKSEPARKAVETQFDLVRADDHATSKQFRQSPVTAGKVLYGRTESKRAIQKVLEVVINQYKFSSLAEFNAVLKQYNVRADPGSEHSRIRTHNGLIYHIIDQQGKSIGVPIKASHFYNTPTLKNLEKNFKLGQTRRKPYRSRIKNAVDLAIKDKVISLAALQSLLSRQGIDLVTHKSEAGQVYGLTYVDHKTKCVFNGSALGKNYSAKAILERCTTAVPASGTPWILNTPSRRPVPFTETHDFSKMNPLELFLDPEREPEYVPHPLKQKKGKKKRPNYSTNT